MKHLASLFLLSFLLCCSCSQQMDDEWKPNEQLPNVPETQPVGVSFSRASLETFAEHGITEVGVYVYLQDSMVYGKNLPLNNGDLKVDLPLGENLQTFIVANADHLVDTDSLSKVVVYQDAHIQKPVYISDVVGFTSDNSVSSLNVELKRLVGQAVFQPKETEEELSAITRFDQLNVTFTNVAIGYKVKSKECITENVTISTNLSTGFGASVYSFPTVNGDSRTSIDVVYLKGGEEVNRIISPLDTGIGFESSKRSKTCSAGSLANLGLLELSVGSSSIGASPHIRATQKYIYPLMQYASANSLFLSDSTPKLIPGVYFNNILQC